MRLTIWHRFSFVAILAVARLDASNTMLFRVSAFSTAE